MTCKEYIKKIENENKELRREKVELKAKVEAFQNGTEVCWQGDMDRTIEQNLALKKENYRIKRDCDLLMTTQNKMIESCEKCSKAHEEQVDKLKEQLEKMKNCYNCRNNKSCREEMVDNNVFDDDGKCIRWELSE